MDCSTLVPLDYGLDSKALHNKNNHVGPNRTSISTVSFFKKQFSLNKRFNLRCFFTACPSVFSSDMDSHFVQYTPTTISHTLNYLILVPVDYGFDSKALHNKNNHTTFYRVLVCTLGFFS